MENLPSPIFVLQEELLEKNLKLLNYIQNQTGAKILLALKGFAMYNTFDLCKKYLSGCCASGLHEALLSQEYFGKETHTYSPAYSEDEFDQIAQNSNHIVFNSFNQFKKYQDKILSSNSVGFRINPQVSTIKTDLYNPCGAFSRLGITKEVFDQNITDEILSKISGLHFHALCEQNVDALKQVLKKFEQDFSKYFYKLSWLNFGGGHHITRDDYDVDGLINLLQNFKQKYPHIQIYLEPGEAVGWKTGYLEATVLDIIKNGINIAILDTSAEAHMPDTLAMPYKPDIRYASKDPNQKKYRYRLGGNTCLAGDIIGDYSFDKPLQVGSKIILEDMIHYTMVKTTTFNGINLPSIAIMDKNNKIKIVKRFGYNEYKSRI